MRHPTPWPVVLVLLLAVAPSARGQTGGGFDLSWNSITSGGSVASSGGSFQLGGSVGFTGSALSGGDFSLSGGFWEQPILAPLGVGGSRGVPLRFALRAARPNPVAGGTTIEFELASTSPTRLVIYDVAGQRVRQLVDATLAAGVQRVPWDARSDTGQPVASGVYFARLEAGAFRAGARIVVLQ